MAQQLVDPRIAQPFPAEHPFSDAIRALSDVGTSGDTARVRALVASTVRKRLTQGDSASVTSALRAVRPGRIAQEFITALDDAINGSDESGEFWLIARVFLMPLLFVTAGNAPASVSGIVPDAGDLQRLLKESGALGPIENFGLGSALGSHVSASNVDPERLYQSSRALSEGNAALDLLHPEDIEVTSAGEQVHLRYLTGAAVSASNAPTFLETAGTVGRWGMRVSQALTRQLAEPGLQLLVLPRAPMRWYAALTEGGFALEELRFNLFLSTALRELRASTGEPEVMISAPPGDLIHIEIASQFDDMQRYSHAWHLARTDTVERVEESIVGLLRDCRAERVSFASARRAG